MNGWTYYDVEPPTKWQAGTVGEAETPFYFDCADCGTDEPEIAGFIGVEGLDHAPKLEDVGVFRVDGGPMVKAAMFCSACYARRIEQRA